MIRLRQSSTFPRRRGAALVIALVISTLLTIIVIEFVYTTAIDLRQAKRTTEDSQVRLAVQSALVYVEALLRSDKERGEDRAIDTLDDVWATNEVPTGFGNVNVHVTISDEAAKLNLANLAHTNEAWAKKWEAAFVRLCEEVREGASGEDYQGIAEEITKYLKATKSFDGVDDNPELQSNAMLLTIDDLLEVDGVTRGFLYGEPDPETPTAAEVPGMWSYLTVHSTGRINLNTTSLEMVKALDANMTSELAEEIVKRRSEPDEESGRPQHYKRKDDVKRIEGMEDPIETEIASENTLHKAISRMITCRTSYFVATLDVALGDDVTRTFRAYYKRNQTKLYRFLLEEVSPERRPLASAGVEVDDAGF